MTETLREEGCHMAERYFCSWCGYPIAVESETTVEGEQVFFRDGETGEIVEECPNCADWLDLARLLGELPALAESATTEREGT